jgi:hypothetical protein
MKISSILILTLSLLLACNSDDPKPTSHVTSITAIDGDYTIEYKDGSVSEIQYHETDKNTTTFTFKWLNEKRKLIVTATTGTDIITNTFEYLNVKLDGQNQVVWSNAKFAEDSEVRVDYVSAPNESSLTIMQGIFYNTGDLGDATPVFSSNKLKLDCTTNNEVIEINFESTKKAWWVDLPKEIVAVLFESEFRYVYFLTLNEVTSISDNYGVKESPDYNDAFKYNYNPDGAVLSIKNNEKTLMFEWTKK